MCVCRPGYPVCNAHVLYSHLWLIRLYSTFPLYPTEGKIFYTLLNITCKL